MHWIVSPITQVTVSPDAIYPELKSGTSVNLEGRKIKIKSARFQEKCVHDVWYTNQHGTRATIDSDTNSTKLVVKFDLTNTSGNRMSAEKVISVGAVYNNETYGAIVFPTDFNNSLPMLYAYSNESVGNGQVKEMVCLVDLPDRAKNAKELTLYFMDGDTYEIIGMYFYK